MKLASCLVVFTILLHSCARDERTKALNTTPHPVIGTWQLLTGTLIEKGDTTVTDYTKNVSFIKIINNTHFAFLQHDLKNGKDSAVFAAGGGKYSINDSIYTEQLEYCSAREWEGSDFSFTVTM